MQRIVDSHLHCSELPDDELIPYARFNGLRYTLSELLDLMEQNDVERGLLLSPPIKGGGCAPNLKIIELCKKSNGRLFPILTAEPSRKEIESVIKTAKENEGYARGFKIRLGYIKTYADDVVFDPLYDFADSTNLPVMFHTGDTALSDGSLIHSHPLTLDSVANRRPGLKIIACHFGNPWIADVGELVYKHSNVYADISGLVAGEGSRYSNEYLESLANKLSDAIYFAGGADKVLFGTDYPVETFSAGLSLVRKLKIDQEDVEKILLKNAEKVFFPD
ncbi:MAG: amidohydrolase family protein [Nitrososphaerales archaeon]